MLLQMALFHPFLWLSNIPLHMWCIYTHVYVYTRTHTLHIFIHSSVDGQLGGFHVLAIISNAAINTVVSFPIGVFSIYMSRHGIAGSCLALFLVLWRNHHNVALSGCTNLHPHQQCRRVPFSPHSRQHLLSGDFSMMAILTGVGEAPHCSLDRRQELWMRQHGPHFLGRWLHLNTL